LQISGARIPDPSLRYRPTKKNIEVNLIDPTSIHMRSV
jgi:hypothetical protein